MEVHTEQMDTHLLFNRGKLVEVVVVFMPTNGSSLVNTAAECFYLYYDLQFKYQLDSITGDNTGPRCNMDF